MIEYYLAWYRLNAHDGYLIWMTDDGQDRVIVDEDHNLVAFVQPEQADRYSDSHGWSLEKEEPVLYDLDAIRAWTAQPDPNRVSCSDFLDAWNLFTDVSTSVSGQDFAPRNEINDLVYDRLFYGCNLPSVTPEGQHYEPIWPPEEIAELIQTLKAGLTMFEGHITNQRSG